MKIKVLVDNHFSEPFSGEHGLSFVIEGEKKILFDIGHSELFLSNASLMNIDIDLIDTVVLSHGHWDHGDGLIFLKDNKKLICHPGAFDKRYRKKDNSYLGLNLSEEEAAQRFTLIKSKEPFEINQGIFFLGEIPRTNDFEAKKSTFLREDGTDDFVYDDSGVGIITSKGLVVISGCAHAGICNTVEHARKITGISNVYGVMGGFHLKEINEVTEKTIEYLKSVKVKFVAPCHCVEDQVIEYFGKHFLKEEIFAGKTIEISGE